MIDMTSCAYHLSQVRVKQRWKNVSRACCRMVSERFQPFYSHSGDITRMYYDGVYDIVTNEEEYTWNEISRIFP